MTLAWKYSRKALGHILANKLELKRKSTIKKTFNHNDCYYIEDLVNATDMDASNLCYKTSTK